MNIQAILKDFVIKELSLANGLTNLDPDDSLIGSGVLDSLAVLQLVAFIEEEFDVTIEDGDVSPDNFETINSIKAFIEQKMRNGR